MTRPVFEKVFSYLLSLGLACAILVLGLTLLYYGPQSTNSSTAQETEWPAPFVLDESLLTARAAVVYEVLTGRMLYAKNAEEILPLASLTKLIAAQAVLARQDPTLHVSITAEAVAPEGDWGFWVGEEWPIDDLIRFALAASSNDAITAAAIGALGDGRVAAINQELERLGLSSTHVFNSTGLDVSESQAGGYGSAHDVALLTAIFLKEHPTFFEATAAPSVTITQEGRTLVATSTAIPLLDMPGIIGAKTGYTDLAGGNLVAAFDLELGAPVVIAVLGSTREGRFADVKLLLEAVRKK